MEDDEEESSLQQHTEDIDTAPSMSCVSREDDAEERDRDDAEVMVVSVDVGSRNS